MSKVSLVKSKGSYEGVTKSLNLIKDDIEDKIKGVEIIVIKINFVTTEIELATTPVEAVSAFIDFVRPLHGGKIIIAEEATFGNTDKAFEKYGFTDLCKKDGNTEVFNSGKSTTKNIRFGILHLPLASIYTKPNFVVSICRPKTHDSVVVTLSIKNVAVGSIKHGLLKNRFKIHLRNKINQNITKISEYVYPDLSIIDGTVGMEGNGPDKGTPINSGWTLSSTDALAADSLAAYLMGFDIDDIGYLNLIKEKGIGKLFPKDKIEIVGEKPQGLQKQFKPHTTFEKQRMWRRKCN